MRKPILTIFYQYNPWQSTIGGIQTIINNFIKYSPNHFKLRLVGTDVDGSFPTGQWRTAELNGKAFEFFPALTVKDDNVRGLIPTTLRYTASLLGKSIHSDFMHFHRIEPTLVANRWVADKTLFIHNDVKQQLYSNDHSNTILWRKFPAAYLWLEEQLIKQFDQILSCNSESTTLYQTRYPAIANRVSFVKNTVDTELFYPLSHNEKTTKRIALAQQLNLPEETQFILFAGRLHPQKDPLLLLRSMVSLNNPNTHLLIAGAGELDTQIRHAIEELGLSRRVSLLGTLPLHTIADLQRIASVFVLTSVYEGLPVSVLEALACGTPIVTTNVGETPKLLTANSGVVCEHRDPDAIAHALQHVLSHPDYYSASACTKIAHPYSASEVIGSIYQDMWSRWERQTLAAA